MRCQALMENSEVEKDSNADQERLYRDCGTTVKPVVSSTYKKQAESGPTPPFYAKHRNLLSKVKTNQRTKSLGNVRRESGATALLGTDIFVTRRCSSFCSRSASAGLCEKARSTIRSNMGIKESSPIGFRKSPRLCSHRCDMRMLAGASRGIVFHEA
jgi:hypothetical protein